MGTPGDHGCSLPSRHPCRAGRRADQDPPAPRRHHRPGRGGAALVGAKLVKDPLCLVAFFRRLLPCLPDGLTLAYARLAKRLVIVTHFHELRHFSATTAMAAARRGDGSRPARHADPALTFASTPTLSRRATGGWPTSWGPSCSVPWTAARSLMRLTSQRRPSWKAPGSSPRRARS